MTAVVGSGVSLGTPAPEERAQMKIAQAARRRASSPRSVGKAPLAPGTPQPPAAGGDDLALPHERDESPREPGGQAPQPIIEQARRDLEGGLVDTDLRATPGLDAQQRERLLRRGL